MASSAIHSPGIYTDIQGLEALRRKADNNSPDAVNAVAKQFEALFIQTMLKNMRSAKLDEGLFDNDSSDFYLDMFDKQISLTVSEGRGVGLAKELTEQMSQYGNKSTTEKVEPKQAKDSNSIDAYRINPVEVPPVAPIAVKNIAIGVAAELKKSTEQNPSLLKILEYRTTQDLGKND